MCPDHGKSRKLVRHGDDLRIEDFCCRKVVELAAKNAGPGTSPGTRRLDQARTSTSTRWSWSGRRRSASSWRHCASSARSCRKR
jgi:hypothetical protein